MPLIIHGLIDVYGEEANKSTRSRKEDMGEDSKESRDFSSFNVKHGNNGIKCSDKHSVYENPIMTMGTIVSAHQ